MNIFCLNWQEQFVNKSRKTGCLSLKWSVGGERGMPHYFFLWGSGMDVCGGGDIKSDFNKDVSGYVCPFHTK